MCTPIVSCYDYFVLACCLSLNGSAFDFWFCVALNGRKMEKPSRADLNPYATVPKTIRFPEDIAYQMDLYAERMNISVGRMLIAIMRDILPLFEDEAASTGPIRQVAVYQTMKKGKVLYEVDEGELFERIKRQSNRKEGTKVANIRWSRGRPRKSDSP